MGIPFYNPHSNDDDYKLRFSDINDSPNLDLDDQINDLTDDPVDHHHKFLKHRKHTETPTHHVISKIDVEHHKIPKDISQMDQLDPEVLAGILEDLYKNKKKI